MIKQLANKEPYKSLLIEYPEAIQNISIVAKKVFAGDEVGEEDLFGFAPEICPEIRYTLHLKGMKIVDTGRKHFFFGPPEIVLNGQVRREVLTCLQDVTSQQKDILHKEIDTGDNVVLPIQQGTPIERVQTELDKILR